MNARSGSDIASFEAPGRQLVVVGDDCSTFASSTIEWAATEASLRGRALRVVACYVVPPDGDFSGIGERERRRLAEAVNSARRRHLGVAIQVATTNLDPRNALLGAASGAALLVVGASGAGSARRWLLSTVARAAARRSSCPVVVVRGRQRQPLRRIVVGVDSSNASEAALDWAVDEAERHGADVDIVHAWHRSHNDGRSMRDTELDRTDAQCIVDLAVRHCEKRTDRSVSGQLVEGEATSVLTAASNGADLLAVGSRGRSGFRTMLFGSVALFAVENAACPVAVIHPHVRS